jgi:tetratricopeptide (TPR) repeat protein
MIDFKFTQGEVFFYRDQYEQAIQEFYKVLGFVEDKRDYRSSINRMFRYFGDYLRKVCKERNDISMDDNYQEIMAQTHLKLGEIFLNRDDTGIALDHFNKSLQIYEGLGGNEESLALTHQWLGRTYHRQNEYSTAERHYKKSLILFEAKNDELSQAAVLVYQSTLAFDIASRNLRKAQELLEDVPVSSTLRAEVRRDLANQFLWNRKDFNKALKLHQQSLKDFALEDKRNIAWSHQALGDIYGEMGEFESAEAEYRKALVLFKELGILHGQGYALDHLGQICLRRGQTVEARQKFEEGIQKFRESDIKDGQAYLLTVLAEVDHAESNLEAAREHYQQALTIWKELSNSDRIEFTQQRLDELKRQIIAIDKGQG